MVIGHFVGVLNCKKETTSLEPGRWRSENPRAKHPQAGGAGGKEVFLAFPFLKKPLEN